MKDRQLLQFTGYAPEEMIARSRTFYESLKRLKSYYPAQSAGIASGFLIAALHTAGLATLPYTPGSMGFLNRILNRPANEQPALLLVTGYPEKEVTVPAIPKAPLSEMATFF